ncbi:MAG: prephenate dehydrogenase/arogenate dehydrogenase family protein [Rhodocyclaceae bacterium]
MVALAKVVVCGVGLIGGSFAMALRRAGAVDRIVGIGRSVATLRQAVDLGVIDEIAIGWKDALQGADLVLLATPVGQMEPRMAELVPLLEPNTLVTDGGSTKRDVVAAARRSFGERIGQFVPSHPIAGAEKSGVAAATADLYQGRRVVITPLSENAPADLARVRACWEACGATVAEMAPDEHDGVFAAVSHLPHLLAFALVHDLAQRPNSETLFGFAAGGFRDFTRIAGSHPEMWRDICLANRDALLGELNAYESELARLRGLLVASDGPALDETFARARAARQAWLDRIENKTWISALSPAAD